MTGLFAKNISERVFRSPRAVRLNWRKRLDEIKREAANSSILSARRREISHEEKKTPSGFTY